MQLLCEEAVAARLRQTVEAHCRLLAWLERKVPPDQSHDLVAIHRGYYEAARQASGLQARAVTLAFKDFVQRRRGKIVAGAPLDEKLYGLKGIEAVSIATPSGRVTIPFRVAGYGAEWNGKSPARLIEVSLAARGKSLADLPSPSPLPARGRMSALAARGRMSAFAARGRMSAFAARGRMSAFADEGERGSGAGDTGEFELLIAVGLAIVDGRIVSG